MMAESCRYLLAASVLLLLWCSPVGSEVAVTLTGKKLDGRWMNEKDAWFFQSGPSKRVPFDQLAYIHFGANAAPLPKVPLVRVLLLPSGQRLTGMLDRVDEKQIVFITSWGKTVTLDRKQVVGVEQDALPTVRDDFEAGLKAWHIEGKASLSQERAFFGKSSLLLDAAGQSATREWKPAARDVSIRLFFYHPAAASDLNWTFAIIPEKARENSPGLVIAPTGYSCANMKKPYGPLKRIPGWHLLTMESADARLRISVDDACLGETSLPVTDAIKGIRIAVAGKGSGKLWIDELLVSRPLAPLPKPAALKDQDMLWLEQGEQLFGRVVSANTDAVVLDARFGQRPIAWSKLRGILFARPKDAPPGDEPKVYFRPGPGFPLDCLRARLVRWDQDNLIVQHPLLAEIAIERGRLDKLRFAAR
jgi:hypothetical protein